MNDPNIFRISSSLKDYREISLRYAGFWTRVVAFSVDITIAMLMSLPLVILAMSYFIENMQRGHIVLPFYDPWFGPIAIAVVSSVLLISTLLESSSIRGTPGKWIAGALVVNGHGNRIPFFQALGRQIIKFNFVLLIVVFPFVNVQIFSRLMFYVTAPIFLINFFLVLLSSRKQTFHDVTAKTYVVRSRDRNFLMSIVAFVVSLTISALIVGGVKMEVEKEIVEILPKEARAAVVKAMLSGEQDIVVNVDTADLVKEKQNLTESNETFEFVDNTIYEHGLSRDVGKLLALDSANQKMLNVRGPVYTYMEQKAPGEYEFKTYLPYVPNLLINSDAFSFTIDEAVSSDGTKLVPQIEDAVSIVERYSASQRYLVATKRVVFEGGARVEKLEGAASLRLPINLTSAEVFVGSDTKDVKMGAQSFQINHLTDRQIEFTYFGPEEYFLDIIAYEKIKLLPIQGHSEIKSQQSMSRTYSYTFNKPVAKYEFNTAIYFYLAKFPFSTNGDK
ncbi:MAG: RDD family protein [Proteobacteria bacterium]|jgi:uncharacterized RDD family membrane protein YckC|nr:RDD family protein [Pseudomonadota bacterium]